MALPAQDDCRFLHEPRALWTVARIQAPSGQDVILSGRQTVNKDHFRNVTRFPITLTKVLFTGVGYTYRQFRDDTLALGAAAVHNSLVAANLVQIAVAAPYSVHWGKRDFVVSMLPPRSTAEPGFAFGQLGGEDTSYASGAWGLSRWEFDRTLWLPRNATIQLDLSAVPAPNIAGFDASQSYYTAISFDEPHTGIFGGNNRVAERVAREYADGGVSGAQLVAAGLPYADAFGAQNLGAQGTQVTWPSNGQFKGKIFNRQESNRGQDRNAFSAFNVMIDQIDYDEEIQTLGSPYTNDEIAPLATRMITRAKCSNGGTNMWWWRPGAPLALVAPTIGPALVADLPTPIVLGPGEELEVEVQVPAGVTMTPSGGSTPTLYQPNYQVGLSFTGYSTIEM